VDDDIPCLLLTPGRLTTSRSVRQSVLRDNCTWDSEYNRLATLIRDRLVRLATGQEDYSTVLMHGSGTYAVEATIGSVVPTDGKVLVVNNGAHGTRIAEICRRLRIDLHALELEETEPPPLEFFSNPEPRTPNPQSRVPNPEPETSPRTRWYNDTTTFSLSRAKIRRAKGE